jgi:hypothetical protein
MLDNLKRLKMNSKQKAHSLLDSIIHMCVKSSKDYKSSVTISYAELAKELGFANITEPNNLKITILARFVDKEPLI